MDKLRAVLLAGGAGGVALGMANRVYPHQARCRHPNEYNLST